MAGPRKKCPRIEQFNQPTKALEELLLRLPADALTRFKHLKYVKTNCSESVLFGRSCGNIDDNRLSLLSALRDNSKDMRQVIEDLDISFSKYIRYRRTTEWASIFHCDAMVSIQCENFLNPINFPSPVDFMKPIDLIVCNLVLCEFKIVPRPVNVECVNCQLIGFEYDSKAENFKIVKIVFGLNGMKAEVHTLGTTTWREIEINTSLDITISHQYDYLNGSGVCYWAMQESPTGECKSFVLIFAIWCFK